MQNNSISASRSISEGFRIAGLNWGLMILFLIVSIVGAAILGNIPYIGNVYNYLIGPILGFGYTIAAHQLAQNKALDFKHFFESFQKTSPMVVAQFISVLLTLLFALPLIWTIYTDFGGWEGIQEISAMNQLPMEERAEYGQELLAKIMDMNWALIFLCGFLVWIPMIFLGFSFHFVWFKDYDGLNAIKGSYQLVKDNFGQILLYSFLALLIIAASAIPCGIGLLFTVPAISCGYYDIFRTAVDLNDNGKDNITEHFIEQ